MVFGKIFSPQRDGEHGESFFWLSSRVRADERGICIGCGFYSRMTKQLSSDLADSGFACIPHLFTDCELAPILGCVEELKTSNHRAGTRNLLRCPAIADFAIDPRLRDLASLALRDAAIPLRAVFFDKTPASNWSVSWHQDRALPMRTRLEKHGWGPWSVKEGVLFAHAPAKVLERVVALRIHFDPCLIHDGPLRVLAGTHKLGVLSPAGIDDHVSHLTPVDCLVECGGVVIMRPLLVHSSPKLRSNTPRRVLHIEYRPAVWPDVEMQVVSA
jgi:Phytanoyl-CoA dioxygenase (PhyH)